MKRKSIVSKILVRISCFILNAFVAAISSTYRVREDGLQHLTSASSFNPNRSYLLACWHETVLAMALAQKGRAYCTMTSRSNAGTVVAYLMRKFGFVAVQGSQSSGGKEVREQSLAYLAKGIPVAITVDGSHGPRRVVKPGIIDLAAKSGSPILPGSVYIDRAWVLKTWDKFQLPKPFARITIVYSEPIVVPTETQGTEFENKLELLTRTLNSGEMQAEAIGASELGFRRLTVV